MSTSDIFARRFASKKACYSAIRLLEFEMNPAVRMRHKPGVDGGKKGVYCCEGPRCSIRYVIRQSVCEDESYWYIEPSTGAHCSCLPSRKRQLSLLDVRKLKEVAVQMVSNRVDRIYTSGISGSVIRAAAIGRGVVLSRVDASRINVNETKELTRIAMEGFNDIAFVCSEFVKENQNSTAWLRIKRVSDDQVTEIVYSSSSPGVVTMSSPLPSTHQKKYLFFSVVFVPQSSYEIVKFSQTKSEWGLFAYVH